MRSRQKSDVRILGPAWQDFFHARDWYAAEREDLANRFEAALDVAVEEILATPGSWPRLRSGHRYRIVKGFPFFVVYFVDGDFVVIAAIAHMRRRPGYWRRRR